MDKVGFRLRRSITRIIFVIFVTIYWTIMAIKKKISLGFVVIGTILLVSSAISIYEFIRMRNTVSNLINDNISAINTSRLMLEVCDEYNFNLVRELGNVEGKINVKSKDDTRFRDYLNEVRDKFTTKAERQFADSVRYAYSTYIIVMNDAPKVWNEDYNERRNWYFNRLYPIYMQLRGYLQSLTHTSQLALADNSKIMSDSFYRSIMPGVVAVIVGIVLVFLFNYFINKYFVNPFQKMAEGVRDYINRKRSYTLVIEGDEELEEFSENIKELVETNKRLSKKS